MTLLTVFDILLLILATMRVTRLVISDDLGKWWIQEPVNQLINRRSALWNRPRWAKYADGLSCPFCVGFWIGATLTALLAAAGGPGDAADWWRYGTGVLALNYVTAHIGSRMGDAGYDEDTI